MRPPGKVLEATKQYARGMDRTGCFLEDCCDVGEGFEVKGSTLYSAYQSWAWNQGILKPAGAPALKGDLEKKRIASVKTNGTPMYRGVRLRPVVR